jgi:hypothetical protein
MDRLMDSRHSCNVWKYIKKLFLSQNTSRKENNVIMTSANRSVNCIDNVWNYGLICSACYLT